MSFAKVAVLGNLGRDPEVRYTPSGALNVQFTIAASGKPDRDGNRSTTWLRCTAWDKLAERINALAEKGHIAKGKTLYVEGQLEQREYTDNSGQQRTSLDVTLTDFQFVGGKQDGQQQQPSYGYGTANANY